MTRETFINARKELNMSQTKFAKLINRSRSYVSKIEQGLIPLTRSAEYEIRACIDTKLNETCVKFNALNNEKNDTGALVEANNELLEKIRKDQERELELNRAQGRQINEALELLQGMDAVVQSRVRDIIDDRTRTIVAISKHQMHSQALITIAAIEGIINMVEEGITKPSLFLRQLRTVRDQLKEMMNDVKC